MQIRAFVPHSHVQILVACLTISALLFPAASPQAETTDVTPVAVDFAICKDTLALRPGAIPNPSHAPDLPLYREAIRETTAVKASPSQQQGAGELRDDRPITRENSIALIEEIMTPNSPLNKSVDAYIASLGGMQSPLFWNEYFRSYDRFVGFAPGYSNVFVSAARVLARYLPLGGRVADLGCGTGNGTAILLELLANMHIFALDRSGLELAKMKASIVTKANSSQAEFIATDLIHDPLPESLDAAMMNNVLYTLGEAKHSVLRKIFAALKPGGIFILNDPVAFVQNDRAAAKKWLMSILDDAIKNGTPATLGDLKLVGALAYRVAMASPSVWLTAEQISELARAAGFAIVQAHSAYYDGSTFMILRKPEN